MKKILLLSVFFCFVSIVKSGNHESRGFVWDGEDREYLEYVPSIYDPSTPTAVVFALHGLGDNMGNFSGIGFDNIADTANFIVITPQALMAYNMGFPIGNAWNSGASLYGITPNAHVDDTGFIMAILDSLENHYNIDNNKVFVTGFSMGGYMSNRLAAEAGDRITAIASVAGTFGVNFEPTPEYNVSVLHIHGTDDTVVEYENNESGMDAEDLVLFWREFNNCDNSPVITMFPEVVEDGVTFERRLFLNGEEDTKVGFIIAYGGNHSWYFTPNADIDYTSEIWRFFSDQMLFPTEILSKQKVKAEVDIFPNPASNIINIRTDLTEKPLNIIIYNNSGKLIRTKNILNGEGEINIEGLHSGIYHFIVTDNKNVFYSKMIRVLD